LRGLTINCFKAFERAKTVINITMIQIIRFLTSWIRTDMLIH
jgi:hypothetical protein